MAEQIDYWSYSQHWYRDNDPVPDDPDDIGWDNRARGIGYCEWHDIIGLVYGFSIEILHKFEAAPEFLVCFSSSNRWHPIGIPDTPSLLEFLRRFAPILHEQRIVGIMDMLEEIKAAINESDV
jgi:hypothetical protein